MPYQNPKKNHLTFTEKLAAMGIRALIAVAALTAVTVVAIYERAANETRMETATIVSMDSQDRVTVFELSDGKRVRKEGFWGDLGDTVRIELYVQSREPYQKR